MYSTCLFCNQDLGKNEVLEHFPVGRRLAYDAQHGRLWVVCRRCERWNLSPLEERWEAIEEAERLFTSTRLRVTTDNIGLARLSEGLELVRIGSALRPEIAAWRYGDQFGRRHRRAIGLGVVGAAALTGLMVAGPVTGIIAGGGWFSWQIILNVHNLYQNSRVRARLPIPGGEELAAIRLKELQHAAIIRADDGWALRLTMKHKRARPEADRERAFVYAGPQALSAAAKLLPAINEKGGREKDVKQAVTLLADAGNPDALFQRYAADERGLRRDPRNKMLINLPKEVRLALEMASHEEQERRAMEGELALLEAAWREAEEIAKIADDLLLPEGTADWLERLRRKG